MNDIIESPEAAYALWVEFESSGDGADRLRIADEIRDATPRWEGESAYALHVESYKTIISGNDRVVPREFRSLVVQELNDGFYHVFLRDEDGIFISESLYLTDDEVLPALEQMCNEWNAASPYSAGRGREERLAEFQKIKDAEKAEKQELRNKINQKRNK